MLRLEDLRGRKSMKIKAKQLENGAESPTTGSRSHGGTGHGTSAPPSSLLRRARKEESSRVACGSDPPAPFGGPLGGRRAAYKVMSSPRTWENHIENGMNIHETAMKINGQRMKSKRTL